VGPSPGPSWPPDKTSKTQVRGRTIVQGRKRCNCADQCVAANREGMRAHARLFMMEQSVRLCSHTKWWPGLSIAPFYLSTTTQEKGCNNVKNTSPLCTGASDMLNQEQCEVRWTTSKRDEMNLMTRGLCLADIVQTMFFSHFTLTRKTTMGRHFL